jgi:flagellar M-ring protein FliF
MKIRATLDPLVGADRFQANVSVDCDLTSGELSEESFDPARTVMLASQKTEDSSGGAAAGGQPGTASNLPRPAASAGGRASLSRKTENITFQSSRTVRRTRQPQGAIRRLSVALLLDQEVRWEGAAPNLRRVLVPPAPEKLKSIRDLVAGAVGFDQNRGDQIVVETLPFEATLRMAPPEAPAAPAAPPAGIPLRLAWPPDRNTLIAAGGAAVALLLLAALGIGLARRRRSRRAAAPDIPAGLPAAPEGPSLEARMDQKLAEDAAMRQRLEAEALQAFKTPTISTKKADVFSKHLKEGISKDPAAVAMAMRSWLQKR